MPFSQCLKLTNIVNWVETHQSNTANFSDVLSPNVPSKLRPPFPLCFELQKIPLKFVLKLTTR